MWLRSADMPIDLHVKSLASICNRFTADLLIIHKTSNDWSTAKKNELDDYSVNYAGWLFVWSLYCECCLTTGSAVIQNYQYTYCDEAWIKRLINDAMTFKLHVVFLHYSSEDPGGSMSYAVGLPNNSYNPITNTAWVHTRFCKLQKGYTSTRSRKW